MRTVPAAGLAATLLLSLAACGTRTAVPTEGERVWQVQELAGERSADFPTVLASDGDEVLALFLSDDGVLQSHLSSGPGPAVAGEPLRTGLRYVGLGGVVRLRDGGWFALGSGGTARKGDDEEITYDAVGFRSDDGLAWRQVEVTGIDGAVDVNDLAVHRGAIVVAGNHRGATDPSTGGFVAAVWTSSDGRTFTETELPGLGAGESGAGEVEVVDGRVLVAGRTGRRGALWSSDDARTFVSSDEPLVADAHRLSALESVGSTVLASTGEEAGRLLRSEDGGRSWEQVDAPAGGGEGFTPVWEAVGRFLTLGGRNGEAWHRPEACYADLAQCGQEPPAGLYASSDGVAWQRVDLADAVSNQREVDEVAGTADGRTVLLSGNDLAVWPSGGDLPVSDEPAGPRTVEVRMLGDGEEPRPGVRYHQPLYVHCGMDWLHLGGEPWRRTDGGPDVETGAGDEAPRGWPVVGEMIFGFATLTGAGVVEYSIGDGEVIATYERGGRGGMCA